MDPRSRCAAKATPLVGDPKRVALGRLKIPASDLGLPTTMLEKLRGLGTFSKIRNMSDSDIPPAKHVLRLVEGAPRTLSSDKYFFLFAAFASLREIIRNSVAA